MDTVEGIECFSQTTWYVVFTTRAAKTAAMGTKSSYMKKHTRSRVLIINAHGSCTRGLDCTATLWIRTVTISRKRCHYTGTWFPLLTKWMGVFK